MNHWQVIDLGSPSALVRLKLLNLVCLSYRPKGRYFLSALFDNPLFTTGLACSSWTSLGWGPTHYFVKCQFSQANLRMIKQLQQMMVSFFAIPPQKVLPLPVGRFAIVTVIFTLATTKKMKITFLHTSKSHINRFYKIVKEIDVNIEIEHFVNEQLLETALRTGNIDKEGFFNEIKKIKSGKFGKIICTYLNSIYYKLDKGNEQRTPEKGCRKKRKKIKIEEINCQDCWNWFEKGDSNRYAIEIANQIKKSGKGCEVIFLAQASMEDAKKYIVDEKYKTLSSPMYGIEKYVELIKKEGSG